MYIPIIIITAGFASAEVDKRVRSLKTMLTQLPVIIIAIVIIITITVHHHHYHSASSSWSPAAPEYVLRCRGCWVPFSRPLENWSTSFCKSNQNLFCHHHDHRYDHDQWSLIIVFFETWTWKLFWRVDLGGRELFASSTQGSPDQKIRIKMIIMTTRHWKWF